MRNSSPSTRREREIASIATKLALALDVPVRFSRIDDSGVSWLDRSNEKNPFCRRLNGRQVICRRCASTSFQFEYGQAECMKTSRVFCISGAVKLVTPIFGNGMFLGVLSCGPMMRERPKREGFLKMLADLKREIRMEDQRRLWRCYAAIPFVREARMKALESILSKFAVLPNPSVRTASQPIIKPHSYSGCLVDRALQLIRNNNEGIISSEMAARSLHVSPSYLSRTFHDVVGEPFHVYVARAHVIKAKVLLTCTSKKISEVALLSGFNSLAAFNRWFSKLSGCTPRDFREAKTWEVAKPHEKCAVQLGARTACKTPLLTSR